LLVLLVFLMHRKTLALRELQGRAEEADNRLRTLTSRVPGMIYQYRQRPDGTSHYPYASEAALKLFGQTPEALNEDAQHLFKLIHPDDIELFHERINRSAESLQEWSGEFRVIFPDGRLQWRFSTAFPQRLEDGSILWHGYSADITERKNIEARSNLLVAALEASANAITITDLKGKIEWVNHAFIVLTGYSREELIGNNPRVLKSGQHEDAFYADMWRTLNAGNVWRGEIVNRRKDGRLFDEELIIAPVRDEKGRTHHYIGVKQDISDRKRMEEELRTQAMTDPLTGLPNRRYFYERADGELARLKRRKSGAAVIIMLDIDFFKRVNDTYGHHVGDEVLKHLAEMVSGSLRRSDCCGRFGGEEFAVLLPEATLEQGEQFAERLREKLANTPAITEVGEISYTASFGLTVMTEAEEKVSDALERADQALYRAKAEGRNRVSII